MPAGSASPCGRAGWYAGAAYEPVNRTRVMAPTGCYSGRGTVTVAGAPGSLGTHPVPTSYPFQGPDSSTLAGVHVTEHDEHDVLFPGRCQNGAMLQPVTAVPVLLRLGGRPVSAVGPVRIYVCGITPYGVTHLGHASTFVWADAAARVLAWTGHAVHTARNVTDVDDVLYEEAARQGQEPSLFGALQRASFDLTMSTLRVGIPEYQPTAAQAVRHVLGVLGEERAPQQGAALRHRGNRQRAVGVALGAGDLHVGVHRPREGFSSSSKRSTVPAASAQIARRLQRKIRSAGHDAARAPRTLRR